MRKRDKQIKKWMKRYIYHEIKGLPIAESWCGVIEQNGWQVVVDHNHTICNGYPVGEGEMIPKSAFNRKNLLSGMKLTAEAIKDVKARYNHVFFRLIRVRGDFIRLRLITERG